MLMRKTVQNEVRYFTKSRYAVLTSASERTLSVGTASAASFAYAQSRVFSSRYSH